MCIHTLHFLHVVRPPGASLVTTMVGFPRIDLCLLNAQTRVPKPAMSGALDRIGKEDRGGGPAYNGFERTRMETVTLLR